MAPTKYMVMDKRTDARACENGGVGTQQQGVATMFTSARVESAAFECVTDLQGSEETGHLASNVADNPSALLNRSGVIQIRFFYVEEELRDV